MQDIAKFMFLAVSIVITACSTAETLPSKTVVNNNSASDIVSSVKTSKVTWYDGRQARDLWLAQDLVAEFPVKGALQGRSLLNTNENTLVMQQAAVRIWRVSEDANTLSRRASQQTSSETFTPVFRDAPGAGSMKALPGGIILILNPDLTQDQVDNWFASQSITIARQLNLSTYAYFIETQPGLEGLDLANQLIEEDNGELTYIQSATPNWWSEKAVR